MYVERSSTNRPLLFNGTNFTFWENGIRILYLFINFDLWNLTEKGPNVPFKMISDKKITKKANEYNEEENKKMT